MTVCLDTSVFLQIFGRKKPFNQILRALLDGKLTLAVSTEILLEYEEITRKLSGGQRWEDVVGLLEAISKLHGNVRRVDPQFRFNVIAADPDDNKFCDCAITAEADFVVTDDAHFDVLNKSGYKPKPIFPDQFIREHLTAI